MLLQFLKAGVYETNKEYAPYDKEWEVIIEGEIVDRHDSKDDALRDLVGRLAIHI